MLSRAVNIKGVGAGSGIPRSHSSCADDKAPGEHKCGLFYLRTNSSVQHDFIDHCILFRANSFHKEIKIKGQKLGKASNTLEQLFHIMA